MDEKSFIKKFLSIIRRSSGSILFENGQLSQAAQVMSKDKMIMDDQWEPPYNWDVDAWALLCSMGQASRLSIAIAFLRMELKRVEELNAGQDE